MGHKSNPIGLRLQINRTWDSRWYAEGRDYAQLLKEDIELRKYIIETLPQAAISKVVIERPAKTCRISIYAARPGVIIGKKGADIEKLRSQLAGRWRMATMQIVFAVIPALVYLTAGLPATSGGMTIGTLVAFEPYRPLFIAIALILRQALGAVQAERGSILLLDPDNSSVTLDTLQRAAKVVGRTLRLELS